MRLERLELLIAADTLRDLLSPWLRPTIETADGAVNVRCRYKMGISIFVNLWLSLVELRDNLLVIHVDASRSDVSSKAVCDLLRSLIDGSGVPGVKLERERVFVDIDALAAAYGVRMRVTSVQFTPAGIELRCEDLDLDLPIQVASAEHRQPPVAQGELSGNGGLQARASLER